MSPSINDVYPKPANFLKAKDFKLNTSMVRTIAQSGIVNQNGDNGPSKKVAIYMEGDNPDKLDCITLNKTQADQVAAIHGEDYSLWPGESIKIKITQGDFKGDPYLTFSFMKA